MKREKSRSDRLEIPKASMAAAPGRPRGNGHGVEETPRRRQPAPLTSKAIEHIGVAVRRNGRARSGRARKVPGAARGDTRMADRPKAWMLSAPGAPHRGEGRQRHRIFGDVEVRAFGAAAPAKFAAGPEARPARNPAATVIWPSGRVRRDRPGPSSNNADGRESRDRRLRPRRLDQAPGRARGPPSHRDRR